MKFCAIALFIYFFCIAQPKVKFKFINRDIPIYIISTSNQNDTFLITHLKDTLIKLRFQIISYSTYNDYLNTYFDNVNVYLQNHTILGNTPNFQREYKRNLDEAWARATPATQRLILLFGEKAGNKTIATCDSIGFSYLKIPKDIGNLENRPIKQMWSVKEIGSSFPDSLFSFLIKKL